MKIFYFILLLIFFQSAPLSSQVLSIEADEFVVGSDKIPTNYTVEKLLYFDHTKGAFRVGISTNSIWAIDSIGIFSIEYRRRNHR